MDRLVMQFLVTEGYKVRLSYCLSFSNISNIISKNIQEAAEEFEKDTKIHPDVELSTIGDINLDEGGLPS